jgi:hypothetical protein
LAVIDGKREQLVGKVQERYGIAKEEAQRQADDYVRALQIEVEHEREVRDANRV